MGRLKERLSGPSGKKIILVILAILLVYVAAVVAAVLAVDQRHVRFYISGPEQIELKYGEVYKEPGVYAVTSGKLFGDSVDRPVDFAGDLNALSGSSLTVPLHASGAYELGTVTFIVSNGKLTVKARIDSAVDGEIDSAKVYVATTPIDAQNLGTRSFSGATGKLGQAISLDGSSYAAVYVKLSVSFDPSGVPGSPETYLDDQDALWQMMQQDIGEAVG